MGELPGVKGATIVDQGTFSELLSRGRDLSNILQEQKRPAAAVDVPSPDALDNNHNEVCQFVPPLGTGPRKSK